LPLGFPSERANCSIRTTVLIWSSQCSSIYLVTYLLTYLLTSSLTPWSRLLLEKLTGSQLVKKFPPFYGTRRFITAFKVPATCPYPEPDQSSPCTPIPIPEDPF
jgi:hypothetical protein